MFVHRCSACHDRKLVFPSQITGLTNTEHGIVVSFTCWCGQPQTMITGRSATRSTKTLAA